METNLPSDESSPETLPELTPAPAAESAPELPFAEEPPPESADHSELSAPGEAAPADELTQLAEASQRARLAPADEERMTALLKEALLGGRAGVARAVEALPKVPWIVGVRAIEQ